ncbi:YrhK family protein [Mycolicibacterium iranicum]|uniref:YrhK family protein n=1 Tax=Mycolicibacterium iranicum TaxID=912594 RepID=UPI000464B8A3|nr:YrhK family protein [Mycolicibacterium iranicum]
MFAVGSTLFALATAPGFPAWAGAGTATLLCFAGSWFFTTAAWMQLVLSERTKRFEWYSAAVQFAGTLLFNVSTGAAVWAHAVNEERRYVWVPDVTGSAFFLVSGALAMMAVTAVTGLLELRSRDWLAGAVNLIGCVAFGVSAVAAFIRTNGVTEDEVLANLGTFVGALCFLAASLLELPRTESAGRG